MLPSPPVTGTARLAFSLFATGALLRLALLPAWGTFDVEVQKAWAARAATTGVRDIYGPSDAEILDAARRRGPLPGALLETPVPKTTWTWGTAPYFVDYPPGSILVLWGGGRLWRSLGEDMPNRRGFNACVNLAPLLGSVAMAVLLARSSAPFGRERALASWVNPALLLAAPLLGYQDAVFGAFGLGAVMALGAGRVGLGSALVAVAGLVKPQGVLLLPALIAVLVRLGSPRAWLAAGAAGLAASLAVLAPWWLGGHLLSALDGCRRPLSQGTLSALGFNVWWIAGWIMRWQESGPWPLAAIERIDLFRAWAGFDPRVPARLAFVGSMLATGVWAARCRLDAPRAAAWAVVLQVHAYALLGTSVHENHTLLAVMVAPLLLGASPFAGRVLAGTTAFAFLNLFLTAGFGRRLTRQATVLGWRAATGIDLSILVALAHVALVVALVHWARREAAAA